MTLASDIKAYVNDNQSIIQAMQPYDRSYHSVTIFYYYYPNLY